MFEMVKRVMFSRSIGSEMKNSNKNREATVCEKNKKYLEDWKLTPYSASDIFELKSSCIPDWTVRTVEKAIPLPMGYSTFTPFSERRRKAHLILHGYVHVGIIQVGLKPRKLGSNTSAIICLRDKRVLKYDLSVMGKVESNLRDGPVEFVYFCGNCAALSDEMFRIDVRVQGDESVTLVYRFHYKVVKRQYLVEYVMSCRFGKNDEKGETTFMLTNIADNNRVVYKKMRWDEIGGAAVEGRVMEGHTNIDWKETAGEHVLKVDVPGFKKEQVKVEVEAAARVVKISGDGSNEEEEEDEDKWHCKERSRGKFLRRLTLPENAELEEMKAAMENGVLTLRVPKYQVQAGNESQVKVVNITG